MRLHTGGVARDIFALTLTLTLTLALTLTLTLAQVASPKLVMEEAPESYKDVSAVVDTCHEAGISNKCVKLRPLAVIKG